MKIAKCFQRLWWKRAGYTKVLNVLCVQSPLTGFSHWNMIIVYIPHHILASKDDREARSKNSSWDWRPTYIHTWTKKGFAYYHYPIKSFLLCAFLFLHHTFLSSSVEWVMDRDKEEQVKLCVIVNDDEDGTNSFSYKLQTVSWRPLMNAHGR